MPRKKNRNKNGNSSNPMRSDPIAKTNFRVVFSGSVASGSSTVVTHLDAILANLGDRGIQFATMYQLWRPTRIVIYQYALANSSLTNDLIIQHALAWSPEPYTTLTTPPTSYPTLFDFPSSKIDAGIRAIKLTITGNQLMSSRTTKWLYTNSTGSTTAETSAGCFFTAISSTASGPDTSSSTRILMYVNAEFKEPVDTSVSTSLLTFTPSTPPSRPLNELNTNDFIDIVQLPSEEKKIVTTKKFIKSENKKSNYTGD
jgi:hypothetical protein